MLHPQRVHSSGVPQELNVLIGRGAEVESLLALLRETRILTLTGSGGSGKTRLASELAGLSAATFRDGVAWIELAPLSDPELVTTFVGDALGLEHGSRRPLDVLFDTLRTRHMLLVLDNCEHLVQACAELAEELVRQCPALHILATSREALGAEAERAWLVRGLAVPESGANVDLVRDAPAVRLFVERARAAIASFELTSANAGAIVQICRRLDGLPLAIELAAARARTLPPAELANRLDDAFKVLSSGSRTAIPRHRTLREAIDWSYRLLSDREQALLQRLSTFAGDFDLDAAESVGADVDLEAGDVLDMVASLVDKSLVQMREEDGSARFQLLDTIRQYGQTQLKSSGNFHRVCSRHAKAYMELAAEAAPHLITSERPVWVRRLERELDNIRVALTCTRQDDVAGHLRFLGHLGWFWYSSGHWAEGRKWLEDAARLPAPESAMHDRARVLLGGAVIASLQGHTGIAVPWVEESAGIFRSLGDESGEAYSLAYQGVAWGLVADERSEPPTRQALDWFRRSGDLYGLRLCLVVLASYCAMKQRLDEAARHGEEAVDVARSYGLDRELAIALQVLAGVRLATGRLSEASALYRECVAALLRDPSLFWTARSLHMLALVSFRRGRHERGAYLMGAASVVRDIVGATLFGYDRSLLEPAIAGARSAIGDTAYDAASNSGRATPLNQLLEELARPSSGTTTAEYQVPEVRANASPLEVRALGQLVIIREGIPLPPDAWRYAKPRELLLFLLSHPDGCTRDQVGLVFWPDASPAQVKNNFHVMLHHVRKALGRADLVTFDRDRYRINWTLQGGVHFDARTFEDTVKPALREFRAATNAERKTKAAERLSECLRLYRGDFLADMEAGDWHLEIRDHLRRLFCEGAVALGDMNLERGLHREAADLYSRVVRVDDLNESAHRKLLLALARSGARNEALRHYERLSHTLQHELGAEPEQETKALYDQLKRAEAV